MGAILAFAVSAWLAGPPSALAQQPGPSSSQEPAAGLQEVVVSAQFREEKLQTTPLAITAITAESIEARGIQSVTDLSTFIPNTVIEPLGAGWGSTMAAFIRGVGLGDNILSFEPGVPIYVDDVYIGRPEGAIFDLLDLERVEVLRGPQGTLFGKNAIGGTVRLISKKPKGDGSGYLEVMAGSRDRLNFRGMTDLSLIPETLYARISFSSKKQDGYFKVLDYVCVHGPGSLGTFQSQVQPNEGCTVDTLGNEDVQSARAAFRLIAAPNLEFNLTGDMTIQRQKGPADKYTVIDPTAFANTPWNNFVAMPTFGVPWDQRFITSSPYTNYSSFGLDPITHRNVPNINDLDHWGVAGILDWGVSENLRLKSVTAYRRYWNKFGRDSDGSPLPVNDTYDDNRHRQVTEELQLTGTLTHLDWAFGGFYYDAYDENRGFDSLLPGVIYELDNHDQQTTRDWAVFAHGVYHFNDKLSVTAGLRYTDDKKSATIYRAAFSGAVVIPNTPVAPQATKADKNLTLEYQWTPDLMTYAKFSTGFRGGGFSPRPNDPLQVRAFGPESLKNFEVGAKSQLTHRIRLNTAAFYARYSDQQNFELVTDALGSICFCEINTGTSRIWGFEAELEAEPVDRLQVQGSFGYLNYLLTDPGQSTLCRYDANGDACYSPRTPKWNGSLGVQYGVLLPGGSSITPRLDAQYQSTIYFTTNNQGIQPGYTLLNGHITWQSANKSWQVALYALNLTDKVYFQGKLSLISLLGREEGNVAPPREVGIDIKRSFY